MQGLVFSTPKLDERTVNRLLLADHWQGGNPDHVLGDDRDFVALIDESNDALERDLWESQRERIADAGERLAHALKLPLKGNPSASILIPGERSPFATDDESGDQDGAE